MKTGVGKCAGEGEELVGQLVAYLSSYHEKAIKALYELA